MNLPLAIECAEAIAAMYRGDLQPTINNPDTDTQVRVEEAHAGEFIVIFPGTASRRDWRTDAKIFKTDWNGEGARTLTISNWRLLWRSEAVRFETNSTNFNARLIIGKSATGADAVGAVVESAVKGATRL